MSKRAVEPRESRSHPRLKLPAMYTLVRVRPEGQVRYPWTGHIYDISESGMRFELDHPLQAGTVIEVRGMLPGSDQTRFCATGSVVRLHDDHDERGPMRMGMAFHTFRRQCDRKRLREYLTTAQLKAA